MDYKMKGGQVAVWIILGLVLVAVAIIWLLLRGEINEIYTIERGVPFEAKSFIDQCTKQAVARSVDKILENGGFVEPQSFARFDGKDITYLCRNLNYYEPCIQQHPMLLREMEEEIKRYSYAEIEGCFDELEREFEANGFVLSYQSPLEVDVALDPGRIYLDMNREALLQGESGQNTITEFDVEMASPVYDLAKIALEISSQESYYCYFENLGYSITYPRYKITMFNGMPDSTKIYTINDTYTGTHMRIATQSCVIPRGLG